MPTKLKPTLVTNFRGEKKITHYYVKNISAKELLKVAEGSDKKMAAKARKELVRRGLYENS